MVTELSNGVCRKSVKNWLQNRHVCRNEVFHLIFHSTWKTENCWFHFSKKSFRQFNLMPRKRKCYRAHQIFSHSICHIRSIFEERNPSFMCNDLQSFLYFSCELTSAQYQKPMKINHLQPINEILLDRIYQSEMFIASHCRNSFIN